jgi:SAM-dependent methyltransferase
MFLEANLQALTCFTPAPLPHPQAAPDLLEAADGSIIPVYQGVALHSPHGALQEAQTLARQVQRPQAVTVVIGLGLGYHLEPLLQKTTGPVIVYEPLRDWLRFVLENVNLSGVLGQNRVFLETNEPDLHRRLSGLMAGRGLEIVVLPGYYQLLGKDFDPLATRLFQLEQSAQLDVNTFNSFHSRWLETFFHNLPFFGQCSTFASWQRGKRPVVVASRGPSLDEALPTLASIQDRVTILAIGGALRSLMEAGIRPDAALFVDVDNMAQQLYRLPGPTDNIPFLVSPFVQTAAFMHLSKSLTLLCSDPTRPVFDWLGRFANHTEPSMPGGGSVSVQAVECAMALGGDPIILLGQDLAVNDGKFYAGQQLATQWENGQYCYLPGNDIHPVVYQKMVTIRGQHGQDLPTTLPYRFFAQQLEDIARRSGAPALYNASIGGAWLEGYTHAPLADLVAMLPPGPKPPLQPASPPTTFPTQALQAALEHLQRSLDTWHALPPMALESALRADPLLAYLTLKTRLSVLGSPDLTVAQHPQVKDFQRAAQHFFESPVSGWVHHAQRALADPRQRKSPPPVPVIQHQQAMGSRMNCLDLRRANCRYFTGLGLDIGPFDKPFIPNPDVLNLTVETVDRHPPEKLKELFAEIEDLEPVPPTYLADVSADGLPFAADGQYDFVIGSHVLEHVANPFWLLTEMLRVLKPGGTLYLGMPDERFSNDKGRRLTPYSELLQAYKDQVRTITRQQVLDFFTSPNIAEVPWIKAMLASGHIPDDVYEHELNRSIHVHVWTSFSFIEHVKRFVQEEQLPVRLLDLYIWENNGYESVMILQKTDTPDPDLFAEHVDRMLLVRQQI